MVVGTAGRRGCGANMAADVDALARSWKDILKWLISTKRQRLSTFLVKHEGQGSRSLWCL